MSDDLFGSMEMVSEAPGSDKKPCRGACIDNMQDSTKSLFQANGSSSHGVDTYISRPSRISNVSKKQQCQSTMRTRMSQYTESDGNADLTDNASKTESENVELRKLSPNDTFACHSCSNSQENNCQICSGQKTLSGSDRLINFFEYVLEFKLGNRPSYCPKNKPVKKTSINEHVNLYYSTMAESTHQPTETTVQSQIISSKSPKIVSKAQHQQKLKTIKGVHYGYSCDQCEMDPIEGPRFHCNECQNFDLCEDCYIRKGHYHELQQINIKHHAEKTMDRISNAIKNRSSIRNTLRNTNREERGSLKNRVKPYQSSIR